SWPVSSLAGGSGGPAGELPAGLDPPIAVMGVNRQGFQETGLSCMRMYGICGSLGEGFMYGCDWLGQPVYLALLKTFQSAPYSSGASGTSVAMIFSSFCTIG